MLAGGAVLVEHVPVIVERVVRLRLCLRWRLGLRLEAAVERLLLRLVRRLLWLLSLLLLELGLRLLLREVRRGGAVRTDQAVRVLVVLHQSSVLVDVGRDLLQLRIAVLRAWLAWRPKRRPEVLRVARLVPCELLRHLVVR